jgi:thiamine biosynthesis protein ThiS
MAVAVNGEIVRRLDWKTHTLRTGDRVEIVGAVQGG